MRKSRPAFTLTELLVVLGVIAVVVGILLPVVGRARASARSVQCQSNLRQIVTACLARAQESRGYLPLAGRVGVPAGTAGYGSLPPALGDPGRTRYAYIAERYPQLTTPTEEQVAPLPMAVLAQLGASGVEVSQGTLTLWETAAAGPASAVFRCPAAGDAAGEPYATISLLVPPTAYIFPGNVRTDYGFNEGLLGLEADRANDARRLRGALAGVRRPAEVVVAGDVDRDTQPSQLAVWSPALGRSGPVTLADVLSNTAEVWPSPTFDPRRHGGSANVAFADGHVEAVPITPAALGGVYLLPR